MGSGITTERVGFGKGASWLWSIDSPIDSIDSSTQSVGTNGTYAESMVPSSDGSAPRDPVTECPICHHPMSFADDIAAGHHYTCQES